MAQPNNNNNRFNVGFRNSGGVVTDVNVPNMTIRNAGGNIIISNALDKDELDAQTRR